MMTLGVDPGTTESAYCLIDSSYQVLAAEKLSNGLLAKVIGELAPSVVCVESIQSYGNIFGKSTIETCYAIGRIQQKCEDLLIPCELYPRPEYAKSICGVSKINDAVVRSALDQRFGRRGVDAYKKGEPLALLRGASDKRSAFAVACYHLDKSGLHHSVR